MTVISRYYRTLARIPGFLEKGRASVTPSRCAQTWKKNTLKREDLKEQVIQYVGENAKRAERVYVWGLATTGALGIKSFVKPEKHQGPRTRQQYPARLRFMDIHHFKPYAVSCGYGYTVYAAEMGKENYLLGTGINTDSQLGYHEMPRNSGRILDYVVEPAIINLPLMKPETTRVQHVACGRAHTVIVTDQEGVLTFGNNAYGQCGRPIVELESYRGNPNINKLTDTPEDISQVVCGQDHTLFVTGAGEVYSCGMGADGQTGLGHYKSCGKPTRVLGDIEGEKVVSVACRGDCVLAVTDKGDLFGWGNSEYGQLAMVTNSTQVSTPCALPVRNCGNIVKAAAGGSICAILNDKGQVFVWGYGILGKGPNVEHSEQPTQIPETLFGRNELQEDTHVVDIQAGLFHFAALTDTGDVYTWGTNKHGCLGLGKDGDQNFPLKVSLPAEACSLHCGVDHMVVLSKSFC